MVNKKSEKMKIAEIAPLWVPIPPYTYGGIELIVHLLSEELTKRKHSISLFSTGDSWTSGKLISVWEKSLWRAKLSSPHAVYSLMFKKILEMSDKFDIIHNHTGFYLSPFSPYIKKPIVSTIHRPISTETLKLFKGYPEVNYVAVSRDQMKSAPKMKFAEVIHNGIDTKKYKFNDEPKDYLLWLSKIVPDKGILDAIEVAKISKERLIIAGNINPDDSRFFRYEVLPRIDGDQIKYVGQADFAKKVSLMRNAKALLFPTHYRETFGLVAVEAQACGTPVIAYPSGAVPELIQNGKTGFLVNSILEMALAIRRLDKIKRKDCRNFVVKNFDVKKMVDSYEKLFKSLI